MIHESDNRLADVKPVEEEPGFIVYGSVPARYPREPKPEPTAKEPPTPPSPDWKQCKAVVGSGNTGLLNQLSKTASLPVNIVYAEDHGAGTTLRAVGDVMCLGRPLLMDSMTRKNGWKGTVLSRPQFNSLRKLHQRVIASGRKRQEAPRPS